MVLPDFLQPQESSGTLVRTCTVHFSTQDVDENDLRRIYLANSLRPNTSPLSYTEVAARLLPLLRPGKDVAVLPSGIQELKEYADFLSEVLKLDEKQFCWIQLSRVFNPTDYQEEVVSRLAMFLGTEDEKKKEFGLVPFYVDQVVDQISKLLDIPILGDDHEWMDAVGDRSLLYRSVHTLNTPSVGEKILDIWNQEILSQSQQQNQQDIQQIQTSTSNQDIPPRPTTSDFDSSFNRDPTPNPKLNPIPDPIPAVPTPSPPIKIDLPRGYVCTSIADLCVAWRLLDTSRAVIRRKSISDMSHKLIYVSSVEQIRLFDFSSEQVTIHEALRTDTTTPNATPEGVQLRLLFAGEQLVSETILEEVRLGTSFFMYRVWYPELYDKDRGLHIANALRSFTKCLVKCLNPRGFGFVQFTVEASKKIYVSDYSTGMLSRAHACLMFQTIYASSFPSFCYWRFSPHHDYDIWVFWQRMLENGLAFLPDTISTPSTMTRKDAGVFPLTYLRGSCGMFLGLAESEQALQKLREATDSILFETVEKSSTALKFASLSKAVKKGAQILYAMDPLSSTRNSGAYLPISSRPLVSLRPGIDHAIVPDVLEIREWWDFLHALNGYDEDQVIFAQDVLTTDISRLVVPFADKGGTVIVPYCNSEAFRAWAKPFARYNVSFFGDQINVMQKFAHRGLFLRYFTRKDEPSPAENAGVKCTPGFVCETHQELMSAFDYLSNMPIESGQQFGVRIVPTHAPLGSARDVVLTKAEHVALRQFPPSDTLCILLVDRAATPSSIYTALVCVFSQASLSPMFLEHIYVSGRAIGWRPVNEQIRAKYEVAATAATKSIREAVGARSVGVLEFSSESNDGQLVLVDAELSCFTAIHFVLKFIENHLPPGRTWFASTVHPPRQLDAFQFWKRLAGNQFIPGQTKKGISIQNYIRGEVAVIIIIGRDESEIQTLRAIAEHALRPPMTQFKAKYSVFCRQDFRTKGQISRVWCQFPDPAIHVRRDPRRGELPTWPLCLLRPRMDKIILPSKNPEIREMYDFTKSILNLEEDQAIWTDTDGLSLDDHIKNEDQILAHLREFIQSSHKAMLIPRIPNERFHSWAIDLDLDNLLIFGDSHEWLMSRRRRGLMYGSTLDDIEKFKAAVGIQDDKVIIPRGFICNNTEDLVSAYKTLNVSEVVIQSVNRTRSSQTVGSLQAIKLIDLSSGPVMMTERLEHDAASDGLWLCPTLPYIGTEIIGTLPMDRVLVGRETVAMRKSQVDENVLNDILACAKSVLAYLKPSGPGVLCFFVSRGRPVLEDIKTSSFHETHFSALFHEAYAPEDSIYFVWKCVPPPNIDIWTFWIRLLEKGVAFTPGQHGASAGVYPLVFLRGQSCTLISIGSDDEEVQSLRDIADRVLREPVDILSHEVASFNNENLRRIWVQSCRPEYRLESQRINLSHRALSLVRPGKDIIILPGEYVMGREFVTFAQKHLGLSPDQVIFTAGTQYFMDDEVTDEMVSHLRSVVSSSPEGPEGWVLVPYAITYKFKRWAQHLEQMGVKVIGETDEWLEKYASKGILHRHVRTPNIPSVLESLGAGNITVAKGWVCDTVADLLEAWRILDVSKAVIKPVFGAAGEGILFPSTEEELKLYDFPMGQVLLEEFLNLDLASDGIIMSPAAHYMESKLIGDINDQIMSGTTYTGWRKTEAPEKFVSKAMRVVLSIISRLKPRGPGGFDFLSVNGQPILSDVNTGRFNGSHFPKYFVQLYGGKRPWKCFKLKPPADLTPEMWAWRMEKVNAFMRPGKSKRGVFPLVYLRGLRGLFIALGRDELDVENMYKKALDAFLNPVTEEETKEWEDLCKKADHHAPFVPGRKLELTLLKNPLSIYIPERLGENLHMLIGGERVLGFLTQAEVSIIEPMCSQVYDLEGLILVPGVVDIHVHVMGGGGEMGPASRTPDARINELVDGGVTTIVGVLGTDGLSRTVLGLVQKVRGLVAEGLGGGFCYTGNYHIPSPTLTGDPQLDIVSIPEIIGVGEVAVSDHRGSQTSSQDLAELASKCRVGGMLGSKCGVLYLHVGSGPTKLQPLRDIVSKSDIPITQILPTHCSRNAKLIAEAIKWCKDGGFADFTSSSVSCVAALQEAHENDVLDHVMISSDAYGSLPMYDAQGNLIQYRCEDNHSLLEVVRQLYFFKGWPLEKVLPVLTKTPATFLKLPRKGSIGVGYDADILAMDAATLDLKYVFCRGRLMKSPGWTEGGFFSKERHMTSEQ